MMKYYKHTETGEVYAYENEADRQEWGAPDLVEMTKKEIDEHLNPTPTSEQISDQARAKRDGLLRELDAIVTNPLRWGDLKESEQQALAAYRQALLDVPQQAGFPEDVDWPAKPEFL